jgi:ribosomal subunit interface protein
MNVILSVRNSQIDEDLRELVQRRFDHLERYEPRASKAEVTLTEGKKRVEVEALVSVDRADRVHARAEADDARSAIDRLVEKLGVQLRRRRGRRREHQAPSREDLEQTGTDS